MKVLAIILSIYVVLLATMPCCVFDNCPDDKNMAEQSSQHDQGDEDGCGTCSPFFNCSSCNSPCITANILFDYSPVFLNETTGVELRSATPIRFPGKIWQPPKIG